MALSYIEKAHQRGEEEPSRDKSWKYGSSSTLLQHRVLVRREADGC